MVDLDNTDRFVKRAGFSGFLQSLAGYYSQFLETDFRGAGNPKRKFSQKTGMNRTGIQLSTYPLFRELVISKLDQRTPASFLIKYGRFTSKIPPTVKTGISSAIKSVETENLRDALSGIEAACFTAQTNKQLDFERLIEDLEKIVRNAFDTLIVQKVLAIIKPTIQSQAGASSALNDIETFSDEIISSIIDTDATQFSEAVGAAVYGGSTFELQQSLSIMTDRERIQQILTTYFENFAAQDLFVELREIISSNSLVENSQIYLNVGEIILDRSKFPIYNIPLTVAIEGEAIRIDFSSTIYVNKKAIDFALYHLKRQHSLIGTNPIIERIFHKSEDETYFKLFDQTFHQILAATRVEGHVELRSSGTTRAHGHGLNLNNEITLSLFDKSEESIVNDYEALMVGLDAGNPLLNAFEALVASFLKENPLSIDGVIEQEWDNTETADRLVFQSPLPLSEEQRKVLSAIRNPDARFIIVEGPPGTGKSHTITAIAFELILRGKNVLILSDKKEALDVVEGKLNDVITKVRGSETEFINPILRLGKNDSNYSNIIKKASIDKLKTSVRTFKEKETAFNSEFVNLENGLRERVNETIRSVQSITFDEIDDFHEKEAQIYEIFPQLDDFEKSDDEQILQLGEVRRLIITNRNLFSEIGHDLETLKDYIRLRKVVAKVSMDDRKLIKSYPSLDLNRAPDLFVHADKIASMKMILFGYLFSGGKIREVSEVITNITGVFDAKPQEKLDEYKKLAELPERLRKLIGSYGGAVEDLKRVYEFCQLPGFIDADQSEVLSRFANTEWSDNIKNNFPTDVRGLLGADDNKIKLMDSWSDLMRAKQNLQEKFEAVPNFDYLREKTQFEAMNTIRLVNRIDERVTDFAIHQRADARTLQQIIRAKSKFPVEMFSMLREAFPCMIAGLRDYAEFIPLDGDLFELVIIDEASQVSIAQALPAILRAKKVLVLGDRRQFGNVKTANASKQLNSGYFSEVMDTFDREIGDDISQKTRAKNFNITRSVMDFFELSSNFTIQLKKHFRGYREMISFSSKYVYPDGLQALKIRGKPISDVIEFVEVEDFDAFELTQNSNSQEADLIFERLISLLETADPPSVAIITPFREQVSYLRKRLIDEPLREELEKKLKLAIFTFDTCQGEERDLIFYSMVANRQTDKLQYIFPRELKVSEDEVDGDLKFQRLNVGFSRGKEKLVFVLSKPIEEFNGSIKEVLRHYRNVLEAASELPDSSSTDQSSPMEARVLEWLKATSFVTTNIGNIEIIPQFELGAYLKALNPTYSHPAYKVDFLIRLKHGDHFQQCIIEYDGFEYHFDQRSEVDKRNWESFLTEGDIEREFVLESYGYKMLRINRFNIGKDPISNLDARLHELFSEFVERDLPPKIITDLTNKANENIQGLELGTHKKCLKCDKIKRLEDFYDSSLKSGYGNNCNVCTSPNKRKQSRRFRRRY